MRIRKTFQGQLPENKIVNTYSTSQTDTYSCNYLNGIVESGSNAYGDYIKYIDGTMICVREVTMTINITTAWGALYVGEDNTQWNYAQSFISAPKVIVDVIPTTGNSAFKICYTQPTITKDYYKTITVGRPTSLSSVPIKATILAIGKWK